ncbi:hypothetical protein H1R20_g16229, partial [Candolleomyces eurysporus]
MYMPDLQEIGDTFINNVQNLPPGPGVSLDDPLAAALQAEGKLRSLFVHNQVNPVLSDPYIGLVNIFDAPGDIRAEEKMKSIYQAICAAVPHPVTCVWTKHAVTIHSQYPYCPVQIVLRLYKSPSEVLTGFDVDARCFAFDSRAVWGNPRGIIVHMHQCNTVDVTRRSPSYEVRLAKYSERSFEILVPDLHQRKIDPDIFSRPIFKLEGLARLLVFESLVEEAPKIDINLYLETIREDCYIWGEYQGDTKHDIGVDSLLELSDYDEGIVHFHVPYGDGWTADRIQFELMKKDLLMNQKLIREHGIHRHVTWVGTMAQCLEDCCQACSKSGNYTDHDIQHYLHGRVSFIEENPGRQGLTGSFNPIHSGEWCQHAYACPTDSEGDEDEED